MGEDRSSGITAGKVRDAGVLTGGTCKNPEPLWAVWFVVLFPNSKVVSTFLGPRLGLPLRAISMEAGTENQAAVLSIRAGYARLGGLISKTGGKRLMCWRPRLRPRRNRSHYDVEKNACQKCLPSGTLSPKAPSFSSPFPGVEFEPNQRNPELWKWVCAGGATSSRSHRFGDNYF